MSPQAAATPAQSESKKPLRPSSSNGLMASYLTHELRAPVTAIRLGLELLQEQVCEKLAADEHQMLALAIKNTSRLQGLVNDILDYAKIMSGKMPLHREPADCAALVKDALDSLMPWAISKGVRLVFKEEEPAPRVLAEPGRVAQVLTNLLSNAIKFTPPRGTVTVSAEEGTGEHAGTVVFKVKDTGPGIPHKDLEKVFEAFSQSVETGKKCEGTGLGLTLSRALVALHGGRIWAESWQGLGATFLFTIPALPEDLMAKVEVYPQPTRYHGLLVDVYRRFNSFIAAFL